MTSNRNETTTTKTTTTNTSPSIQELFYDLFDILDEDADDDVKEYARIEENFNLDFNFDYTHHSMEEEEETPENDDTVINENDEEQEEEVEQDVLEILQEEEEILSSRSCQLLTIDDDDETELSMNRKRQSLPIKITKKIRTTTTTTIGDNHEIDQMPAYLLAKHKLFDRMIEKNMDTTSSIDIEDLRQVAFFIHYLKFYTLLDDLWSMYLKAGTGQLRDQDEDDDDDEEIIILEGSQSMNRRHRCYWPKQIQSFILEQDVIEENEQLTYERMVNRHLRQYKDKIQHYQTQFNEKKRYLINFTPMLEEKIELFVQQQHSISYHRKKCHFAKAMLNYDYDDHQFQYEYQQKNPTDYQIQIAKRLYDINVQLETVKSDYIEFRERILCNRPFTSMDIFDISLPSYVNAILDRTIRQQLIHQHETLIQQTKTELMSIYLAMIQARIAQYQLIIKQETDQMYKNTNQRVPNKEMTKPLLRLIAKRIDNMIEKFKLQCHFNIDYYIRNPSSDDLRENRLKEKQTTTRKRIGFLSNLMIDTTMGTTTTTHQHHHQHHHLTDQQLRLLNRGPTYVSPCQLYQSSLSMDDMLKKQYKPLIHKMTVLFLDYTIALPISERIKTNVKEEFKNLFSIPIPSHLRQRACYEKKLIQSIQRTLKRNNLILRRTSDQNNLFYLGDRTDFHVKSNDYMEQNADNYTVLLTSIDENNQQQVYQEIEKHVQSMNFELEKLFQEKRFHAFVHKKLQVKIENLKLPYLYFLPDVSTPHSLQVKPMISAHQSVTSKLAKYLHRLLQPLIPRYMNQTIFVHEADFIQKLHYYTYQEHHLHPTTLFATIKITNFHTMVSHTTLVDTVKYFLTEHLFINSLEYRLLKTTVLPHYISINTIKQLTKVFLDHNIFYYNGNIYKFIKGSPNSLLFSETLSNIYFCVWQNVIFKDPRLKDEFYGRYKDEIFLTWNSSKEELITFLTSIAEKHRHIPMEISIGRSAHFLNAHIENRHGQLYTCVYHPPNIPKYTLPYVVDHAKSSHGHWFLSSLIRAVRFCSNFNDFIRERIYLEMTCFANGYSRNFIETQLKYFFKYFNAQVIRFDMNQILYDKFRERLFDFIDKQRIHLNTYQELEANERIIEFYYLYNYGPQEKFHRQFHQIWSDYLSEDAQLSNKKTKIILKPKQIYSLNALLAQQKPPSSNLLKSFKK